MTSLYLHIPFCGSRCSYCDFYSTVSPSVPENFVKVLMEEAVQESGFADNRQIDSVYFGGGTPSLLSTAQVRLILHRLSEIYEIQDHAEISLEANPDDVNKEKAEEWKSAGINRISLGIQSFADEDLTEMNRRHNAEGAFAAFSTLREAGFENISLDLIYGLPWGRQGEWEKNLDTITRLRPEHISAYHLGIEPETPLYRKRESGEFLDLPDEESYHQFLLLVNRLKEAGYQHYEISNFCLPGRESKHNSAYWNGKTYLGLGPSAHSYKPRFRRWNAASLNQWMNHFDGRQEEKLSPAEELNEFLMTRLRTAAGLDLRDIAALAGKEQAGRIRSLIKTWNPEYYELQGEILSLTTRGFFIADELIRSLFYDE
jgi:oxygen-independent coproporphyrinogen-3 oxidase